MKPDAFIAGPLVRVSARYLMKHGVVASLSLPSRMVARMMFELSSVHPGTTHVLAYYEGKASLAFDLQIEELLELQQSSVMVKDLGKLKVDVGKTIAFLNERMRI